MKISLFISTSDRKTTSSHLDARGKTRWHILVRLLQVVLSAPRTASEPSIGSSSTPTNATSASVCTRPVTLEVSSTINPRRGPGQRKMKRGFGWFGANSIPQASVPGQSHRSQPGKSM